MSDYIAITHRVSPKMQDCELTYIDREAIDFDLARKQHKEYCQWLHRRGVEVVVLEDNLDHPDSVFVEDTSVVFDEVAVLTRPGAESRRGEVEAMADQISPYREVVELEPPATLDGGDVLTVGNQVLIGLSTRTNQPAIDAMEKILAPYGYQVTGVPILDSLHLKTCCTSLDDETLLLHRPDLDATVLEDQWRLVDVPTEEAWAANVLRIEDHFAVADGHPQTTALLDEMGYSFDLLPISEFAKAEGSLTCMSVVFSQEPVAV